jgi:hypothetical protein
MIVKLSSHNLCQKLWDRLESGWATASKSKFSIIYLHYLLHFERNLNIISKTIKTTVLLMSDFYF